MNLTIFWASSTTKLTHWAKLKSWSSRFNACAMQPWKYKCSHYCWTILIALRITLALSVQTWTTFSGPMSIKYLLITSAIWTASFIWPEVSIASKNSLPAGETHIIFKRRWLLTKFQPSPTNVAPYVLMNIFILFAIWTFILCFFLLRASYICRGMRGGDKTFSSPISSSPLFWSLLIKL